jgi:hypothetical protein
MSQPWRVRFDWDTSFTFESTQPQKPWQPRVRWPEAADAVSASGFPVTYKPRTEHLLVVRLRLTYTEWVALRTMLLWATSRPNVITFFPDADDLGTSFTCWLEAPLATDDLEPGRVEDSVSDDLVLDLTLRRTDGGSWDVVYFL